MYDKCPTRDDLFGIKLYRKEIEKLSTEWKAYGNLKQPFSDFPINYWKK